MVRLSIELEEETHQLLFDLQNERRKQKKEPTAINKIGSKLLIEAFKAY